MERQHERVALIEEKDNYCGIFDHLVEGVFRTTPDGHYSAGERGAGAHLWLRLAGGTDGEHQGHRAASFMSNRAGATNSSG